MRAQRPGGRGWLSGVALLAVLAGMLVALPPVDAIAEPVRQTARVAGGNRIETAVALSRRSFPTGAGVAYLARADVFADALAAGTLTDGPVLLVPKCGSLPTAVATEIGRLDPQAVLALGGTAAVCDGLLDAASVGRQRGRIAGGDRLGTAVQIARRQFPGRADEVYLASSSTISPDAVAGGSLTGGPILLVPPTGVPPQVVLDEVARLAPARVLALGGAAAISDQTVIAAAGGRSTQRLAGANRYATAAQIAEHQFGPISAAGGVAKVVYLARGDVFADAVAAGSLRDGPVLLVPACAGLPEVVAVQIRRLEPETVVALGGTAAVCDPTLAAAGTVPAQQVVIPDSTVVLDRAAREALRDEESDGTLVFDAAGAPDAAVGDVLVSYEVPGVAPQGLLREVTSVAHVGDAVHLGTQRASLTDAIHDGDLTLDVPLTRSDLLAAHGPAAGVAQLQTSNLVDIEKIATITLADGVTLTGSFTYNANFEVDLDIDLLPSPHLETFTAALSFDESAGLTLDASHESAWTPAPVTIWEGEFRCFWTAIGPVPVSFCPYVTVDLSASGTVEGQVSMSVGQSASARFGAEYGGGAWSPIDTYTHDHSFQPPSLSGQADVKGTFRAQLGLEVYDLAGPYVYGELFARGEAEVADSLRCWGLYAGIAGGFGVAVDEDILGELEIPELDLVSAELLLAEHPVPHDPCQRLTREGPGWFGTVTLGYEYDFHDPEPTVWEMTQDTNAVIHLTGAVTENEHQGTTWDDIAGVVLSADEQYDERIERATADPAVTCWETESWSSTGLTENRTTSYSVHPSWDAAVPVFKIVGADYTINGSYATTCDTPYSESYTSDWGWGWDTSFEAPTATAVAGGRRICDTISVTYDHSDGTVTDRTTITATFAIADGTATPDCPTS